MIDRLIVVAIFTCALIALLISAIRAINEPPEYQQPITYKEFFNEDKTEN